MDSSLTPTVGLLSALIVLSVIVMTVGAATYLSIRWTNRMRDLQTKVLESQLRHLSSVNSDLLNKLISKDAMTYSTLAMQTNSLGFDTPVGADHLGLVPSGTDQAELARYQQTYGLERGEQLDDDSDDITEYLIS